MPTNITIKGIPDEVYQKLKLQADKNHRSVNSEVIMTLMAESTCSACDCEFVALASEFDVQLVTFDKKFIAEFPATAIHPKDFVVRQPGTFSAM